MDYKTYTVREYSNGDIEYRKDGELHRDNGPAIITSYGSKFWYNNGKLHRLDGPAVESAHGSKYWYKDGLRHRDNGPACEYSSGYKEYYLNGEEYSEVEYDKKINNSKSYDIKGRMVSEDTIHEALKFWINKE